MANRSGRWSAVTMRIRGGRRSSERCEKEGAIGVVLCGLWSVELTYEQRPPSPVRYARSRVSVRVQPPLWNMTTRPAAGTRRARCRRRVRPVDAPAEFADLVPAALAQDADAWNQLVARLEKVA